MGGFQNLAYQWLLPQGFMTEEKNYPYEGTTDFCRKDAPRDVEYTQVNTALPLQEKEFTCTLLSAEGSGHTDRYKDQSNKVGIKSQSGAVLTEAIGPSVA